MKKWYSIGLLVIALVLASAFVVACGEEAVTTTEDTTEVTEATTESTEAVTETTEEATETTEEATDDTGGGVDINTIGLYFEDMGNNILKVTDVPVPGMSFAIDTSPSNDFACTVEVFDADGNSLGMLETLTDETGASTGEVDYSMYADTAAKIVITTFDGVEHEYELGM